MIKSTLGRSGPEHREEGATPTFWGSVQYQNQIQHSMVNFSRGGGIRASMSSRVKGINIKTVKMLLPPYHNVVFIAKKILRFTIASHSYQ